MKRILLFLSLAALFTSKTHAFGGNQQTREAKETYLNRAFLSAHVSVALAVFAATHLKLPRVSKAAAVVSGLFAYSNLIAAKSIKDSHASQQTLMGTVQSALTPVNEQEKELVAQIRSLLPEKRQ